MQGSATPFFADPSGRKVLNLFLALFACWWLLLLIFNAFPEIDIAVSQAFFSKSACREVEFAGRTCGSFLYDQSRMLASLRSALFLLPYFACAALLLFLMASKRKLGPHWRTRRVEMSLAALLSLGLGCGLFVNLVLKEFVGRPRPRDTTLFGGDLDFVQAGSFAGKCVANCSFVSGEASSAGWLFCLVLVLPPRWRAPVGLPIAVISVLIPAMRVIIGAHYLSDAVLGWLSSLVVFAAIWAARLYATSARVPGTVTDAGDVASL